MAASAKIEKDFFDQAVSNVADSSQERLLRNMIRIPATYTTRRVSMTYGYG